MHLSVCSWAASFYFPSAEKKDHVEHKFRASLNLNLPEELFLEAVFVENGSGNMAGPRRVGLQLLGHALVCSASVYWLYQE